MVLTATAAMANSPAEKSFGRPCALSCRKGNLVKSVKSADCSFAMGINYGAENQLPTSRNLSLVDLSFVT